jgi:hypothetical protein
MPSRYVYTVPFSGKFPHREHRSKKGRRYWPGKEQSLRRKRKIEKDKIKVLEEESL